MLITVPLALIPKLVVQPGTFWPYGVVIRREMARTAEIVIAGHGWILTRDRIKSTRPSSGNEGSH
jgi:hypothetical protein